MNRLLMLLRLSSVCLFFLLMQQANARVLPYNEYDLLPTSAYTLAPEGTRIHSLTASYSSRTVGGEVPLPIVSVGTVLRLRFFMPPGTASITISGESGSFQGHADSTGNFATGTYPVMGGIDEDIPFCSDNPTNGVPLPCGSDSYVYPNILSAATSGLTTTFYGSGLPNPIQSEKYTYFIIYQQPNALSGFKFESLTISMIIADVASYNTWWHKTNGGTNPNTPTDNTVTLTITPATGGFLRTADSQINCSTSIRTCSSDYTKGTTVTLSAVPTTGYQFTRWTGDCSGITSPTTITLAASHSCSASFTKINETPTQATLTVSKTGDGSGSVASNPTSDINATKCGEDAKICSATFPIGNVVALTPTAAEDSFFVAWGEECLTGSATLTEDRTCTAEFAKNTDFNNWPILSSPFLFQFDAGDTAPRRLCVKSNVAPEVLETCENKDEGILKGIDISFQGALSSQGIRGIVPITSSSLTVKAGDLMLLDAWITPNTYFRAEKAIIFMAHAGYDFEKNPSAFDKFDWWQKIEKNFSPFEEGSWVYLNEPGNDRSPFKSGEWNFSTNIAKAFFLEPEAENQFEPIYFGEIYPYQLSQGSALRKIYVLVGYRGKWLDTEGVIYIFGSPFEITIQADSFVDETELDRLVDEFVDITSKTDVKIVSCEVDAKYQQFITEETECRFEITTFPSSELNPILIHATGNNGQVDTIKITVVKK